MQMFRVFRVFSFLAPLSIERGRVTYFNDFYGKRGMSLLVGHTLKTYRGICYSNLTEPGTLSKRVCNLVCFFFSTKFFTSVSKLSSYIFDADSSLSNISTPLIEVL